MSLNLFAEILPSIEEGYKRQVLSAAPTTEDESNGLFKMMRNPIRVVIPLPISLLDGATESLEAVCMRLSGIPWIDAAGLLTDPIKNADGEIMFDPSAEDMVAIEVTCKPFHAIRLS